MKKLILLLLLANSMAATAQCSYGVGLEGSVSESKSIAENYLGQLQRSLRVPALGIKCGRLSASTNNISGFNSGYDILTGSGIVRVKTGRWSVGYNILQFNQNKKQYGVGVSLSRIKQEVEGVEVERYYQPHLTVSMLDSENRLGIFASLGERKSIKSIVLGVYYVFGD